MNPHADSHTDPRMEPYPDPRTEPYPDPRTADPRRQRTDRARYSRSHLEILNYVFSRMRYPTMAHQAVLARRLGIRQQQIKVVDQ